ncbi:methanogen homoaconitase large subunit [Anaeramoeba flamelloides]|uniref:Methanogen homoaconitase large subunit n=1 Tax=Anaeramoeba flamelloides TaxID=1746091 RepID=A0AAV8AAB9_9EUKA|nr:methanogen homoaconitase large subunit [Anaeramoeba flamelloides]
MKKRKTKNKPTKKKKQKKKVTSLFNYEKRNLTKRFFTQGGKNLIQKIFESHTEDPVSAGAIVDVGIDVRVARDFGGANVVKHLENKQLPVENSTKTFFTFDCNPAGSSQKYAINQQKCRLFARKEGIKIFDIGVGIGTHLAIEENLVKPGQILVSTDSHANILGAIGAFGQGMGDLDIAASWSRGKVWFKVPKSCKVEIKGTPGKYATPKDVTLKMVSALGANGLLGYAAEMYGQYVAELPLAGRVTMASMATEMAGIIMLFSPTLRVLKEMGIEMTAEQLMNVQPDRNAKYDKEFVVDIDNLEPMVALPGHPDNVVPVSKVEGTRLDSGIIGSCTNGTISDLVSVAKVLRGRKIHPDVVLKIVPASKKVYDSCLQMGLIDVFAKAGALVGSPGCAGCAEGQIGMTGKFEVELSTGNRNFTGKQGKGKVFLASPETVASSSVVGKITTWEKLENGLVKVAPRVSKSFVDMKDSTSKKKKVVQKKTSKKQIESKPTVFTGRVWKIDVDNIDTDMIFHNRYLTITDRELMGQYTFDNLEGYKDFAKNAKPNDIVITSKNFGAGSSRQQAVDCFLSLGINLIVAESFGAIYERNAINAGMPIIQLNRNGFKKIENGERVSIDIKTGLITKENGQIVKATPASNTQLKIYSSGGLLDVEEN